MNYANPFELIDRRLSAIENVLHELRRQGYEKGKVSAWSENEEILISTQQAADYLNISVQTVYQNIKKIPHQKRHGRLYFLKSKLSAYLGAEEGQPA